MKCAIWFLNGILVMILALVVRTYTYTPTEHESYTSSHVTRYVYHKTQKVTKPDVEERFRRVIREACAEVGLPLSRLDETLILETLAVESDLGLTSSNISQVTEDNYQDMVKHYIRYNPELSNMVGKDLDNFKHSIQLCRLHYLRLGVDTPKTRKGRAKLWKERYNTSLGAGKVKHYMTKASLYFGEV